MPDFIMGLHLYTFGFHTSTCSPARGLLATHGPRWSTHTAPVWFLGVLDYGVRPLGCDRFQTGLPICVLSRSQLSIILRFSLVTALVLMEWIHLYQGEHHTLLGNRRKLSPSLLHIWLSLTGFSSRSRRTPAELASRSLRTRVLFSHHSLHRLYAGWPLPLLPTIISGATVFFRC